MHLSHVVPHIDQEAAGPSYSVPRLCASLAARGNEVELSCLAARGAISGVTLDLHPEWPFLRRFAISSSLAFSLRGKARHFDIIHNHSLWSMVNVAAGWVVPGQRAKLVTSPRGTLSRWALSRSKWVKRLLWPLQRRALALSDLLHATSEVECGEIRALGFSAPVAVIPNGIDLPDIPENLKKSSQRTLLFLSRIHPTKGVDLLVAAWEGLESQFPDWKLKIAGHGEPAHVKQLTDLLARLDVRRVELTGPLYGTDKSDAYFDAQLFVLPTHSENFGMVVAEALAHGCPAVVSRGAPWSGLETQDCGWWVEHDVPQLTAALAAAMSLSAEQLAVMGRKGRDWMERDFSWASVADRMHAAYRWTIEGGTPPACINLSADHFLKKSSTSLKDFWVIGR